MTFHKLTPSTCLFQSCTSQSTSPRCHFLPHLKSYYLCVCIYTHMYTNTYTYKYVCTCICIPQDYNYKYNYKNWFFFKINNLDGCAIQQLQGSTLGVKGWSHTWLSSWCIPEAVTLNRTPRQNSMSCSVNDLSRRSSFQVCRTLSSTLNS